MPVHVPADCFDLIFRPFSFPMVFVHIEIMPQKVFNVNEVFLGHCNDFLEVFTKEKYVYRSASS